ncbi:MAG: aldo/keto reductase [Candidatus Omnitrophica bacterium]|nr:aldo/keto reductase [Candidatus Omnitrophota bacterium]
MKYRLLGRTGLNVSEMGFGCWAIGGTGYGPTNDEDSLEALETAWNHGVNFFDTADVYGNGHSENLLACFLKNKPRDQIIIATKVGWDFYHGGNRKEFSAEYIHFACGESLKRLGVDTVDLYQLHNPSEDLIRQGEIVGILEDLKKQGKIRFIGISVHTESEGLCAIADERVDSVQVPFNLLDQRMSTRVFEESKKKNTGVIVREPLACGILTGKYHAGHMFAKNDHRRRWPRTKLELDLQKIDLIKTVLSTHRLPLTQAALEYILDFDAVSTVIPGAKTKAQVQENLKASEDPELRIEEASLLRDLYNRKEIFQRGLQHV